MSWRDEVLTWCSGNQHPSSSPVKGAGRARVSAPPAPLCHALVATGVVRHQSPAMLRYEKELDLAADFAGSRAFVLSENSTQTVCPLLASVVLGTTVSPWDTSWVQIVGR